jgi:hypothetical protein
MNQVTCFLFEGINHVPVECKFYSMVQRMNQQAKDEPCQLLGKNKKKEKNTYLEIAQGNEKGFPQL